MNNTPPLNQVEVFHESIHATSFEGEIRDIRVNDLSMGSLRELESKIVELKKQLTWVFAVSVVSLMACFSFGLDTRDMKLNMTVQEEGRKIMSQTMNDMRNRVHYMMDVTPLNRAENPYQDYKIHYHVEPRPTRNGRRY